MFSSIGFPELMVILLIALLLFGGRLPQVGRALGEGIRNFKKGIDGAEDAQKTAQSAPKEPAYRERAAAQPVDPHQLSQAAERQREENRRSRDVVVDVEHQNLKS